MMKAALRRVVIATVFATSINAGYGETWWMPDKNRFHHVDSAETTANNSTWVYATTKHDLDRMLSVVDLFPPYMFDSKTQYLAGGSIGPHTNYGYIIMVDGGQVTFVVTEDRATDLAGSRIMTYLLIRDLASIWRDHGGHSDVTVSMAYVPSYRDPVVFAIGVMTGIGVKVVMAE
jgi:hypothetical protein